MTRVRRVVLACCTGLVAAMGSSPRGAGAQVQAGAPVMTGDATVDSSAVARTAFRDAARASSSTAALPFLLRAARAWPTQPAYWASLARMAARTRDTSVMVQAIDALTALGAGSAVLRDTSVHALATAPAAIAALARLASAVAPVQGGHVIATIADSTVFAEGLDAHPTSGALYVASIRHRTIYEVRADGIVRDLGLARHARVGGILGVRVSADGRSLFATTAGVPTMRDFAPSDTTIVALLRIRIADGALEQRVDVPPDGTKHLLGDLTIAGDGTVYVTDSDAPILFRLRPNASRLEPIRHPLFRSLQGVLVLPAASNTRATARQALIVADYSHGLLRVDVEADLAQSVVSRITDAAGSTTLGIDGITWHDGSVVAVQNGVEPVRIARFTLDASRTRVLAAAVIDRQPELADEPTIVARWRDGVVYVANSQWEKYDGAGARVPGTRLASTRLVFVPLGTKATPNQ